MERNSDNELQSTKKEVERVRYVTLHSHKICLRVIIHANLFIKVGCIPQKLRGP